MPRTAQVLTIPRRKMTPDELESQRADAFRQVEKSERLRNLHIYGGMVVLFALGMIAEYLLTHL